ncbi:MAG TPA: hypothetical protein VMF58_10445 [Rhizomicrobium sp.]|nr:hypothetical protein [Rhizomicrobium sp.]
MKAAMIRQRLNLIALSAAIAFSTAALCGTQTVTVPGQNNNVGTSSGQRGGQTAGTINNHRHITINGNCNAVGTRSKVNCSTTLYMTAPNVGTLVPSNLPVPQFAKPCIDMAPGGIAVIFGDNVGTTTLQSQNILRMNGVVLLAIGRANNQVVITKLKIFDEEGRIIANVDEDGFWVTPLVRIKHRPSSLVVFDERDTEVLNINFLNPKTVSISGVFRNPSQPPVVVRPAPEGTADFRNCSIDSYKSMFAVDYNFNSGASPVWP